MNRRPFQFLLALCALGVMTTASAASMTEEEASAVLKDDNYFRQWSQPEALKSVEQAEQAKSEGERATAQLEAALKDMTKVCYSKFFVNHCIEEAREQNMLRTREIRQISNQAESILRAQKTREIQERRAKAAAETKEPPMKPRTKTMKEPKAPSTVSPKTPKAASTPMGVTPKTPQAASEPMNINNTAADRVKEKQQEAAEKKAQEAENIRRYEEKQRVAKERLESAESQAKERQAERAAQQADYEKSRKEREDAQQRLQDQQNQNRSSLSKYF